MSNEEIYEEMEKAFTKTKKELGFKATLEELDEIFFLKDDAGSNGFISENYNRQLCHRMTDTFFSWYNYFHSIVMPNPQSIVNMTENQAFNEEEQQEIGILMNKIMTFIKKNQIAGITKDKQLEAEFIDESLAFWKNELKDKIAKYLIKVNKTWEQYSKPQTKKTRI